MWARVAEYGSKIASGGLLGMLTGFAGAAVHLWTTSWFGASPGFWPVGLALALGLTLAVDIALVVVWGSPLVMFADAAGRGIVVLVLAAPGPGGNLVLLGAVLSEVWVALSVLLPALAAPVLSTRAAVRRARRGRGDRSVPETVGRPG